jgi:hypothetical protein
VVGAEVIATTADADLVLSVTEVAVTVTVPPAGTLPGAWNDVATPLPVLVGLKKPHGGAPGPQFTVQVTPALAESLATTAVKGAVALMFMETRGGGLKVTEIAPPCVIVIVAEALLVLSVAEVALMVTVLPDGIAGGAVYVVGIVLAVLVG